MTAVEAMLTVAFAILGGVIGWVYCLLVRHSVADITRDKARMTKFLAFMVVRVLLVVAGFVASAYFGIWPIIGNMAGFFVIRSFMTGRTGIAATAAEEAKRIREAREERHGNG